jgi:hypothetical protein
MRATVDKGFKETLSLLEDLAKQQKFAQAITAQHAAREVKQWTIKKLLPPKKPGPTGFKRRTGWTTTREHGFRVSPKRVNRNKPTAIIQADASWIQDHEKGTTRSPRHPKLLGGVPLALTGKGRPRTSKYAKVPAFKGPVNMLRRGKGMGPHLQGRTGWNTFLGKTRKGEGAIYIRTEKGITAQYIIKKTRKIKPKLGFVKRGTKVAKKAYVRLYAGNLIKALKSSNRRKVKTK